MEPNSIEPHSTPPVIDGGSEVVTVSAQQEKAMRFRIAIFGFFLFLVFVVGLFWMITTPELTVGLTLSFVAGLSMIFLPCTLPLAFVIVPLTMGKDPKKGLLMALSFTLGLTITLSLYGVFIAAIGKTFGLKSDAEVYAVLLGGFAAFIFGLSEVGLLKFKLPSYSGNFPGFIQRQKDYMKTFLLGLLLGNAGVGCPNPAFYLLLGYIATTGDLFNGWFLGFIHGMGRSVPLIFLAILGTLGVNALSGVARHKEGIQKVMGWMLLIIGAYLLTFGIFGHDWFIASGIHSGWEQFVVNVTGDRFGETILQHKHKLIDVAGFIQYGNMFFLGLVGLTISVAFIFKELSRRTKLWLSITYIIIALIVGYSTAWTFKLSPNMRMQHGTTAASSDAGGAHTGGRAVYHEEGDIREGLAVNLNITPIPVLVWSSTRLDFFVNQKPGNIPVGSSQLQLIQIKPMHLIGVRDDMNEFFHIHPQPTSTPGMLTIAHTFTKPGNYKMWSEVSKDGTDHIFGHPQINVSGSGQAYNKEIFVSHSSVVDGYQVVVNYEDPLARQQQSTISFEIHDSLGKDVQVEPYLEADIHLTIIKDDWKQFIHAHPGASMPMSGESHQSGFFPLIFEAQANGDDVHSPEQTMAGHGIPFSVLFPEGGVYRMYAQFRPKGSDLPSDEALTAMFWVRVSDTPPSLFSTLVANWWLKLVISAILIVILSMGMKKFLSVSPS